MSYRAAIDFSNYTGPDLLPAAQAAHDGLAANAAKFPNLPVPVAALATLVADYEAKLAGKRSRATADHIAFNVARHALEDALSRDGDYVNGVANGDQGLLTASGFRVYDTSPPRRAAPPAAPTDLQLRHGNLSGTVVARYHPYRLGTMNEVQTSTGDPNDEAGWRYAGMFSGGKAKLGGLAPATTIWTRVRTAGKGGVVGPWSDPAKIIVV